MAEQQVKEPRQGLLSTLLSLIGRTFGVLVVSLILSIIIEWVGMTWFWQDQGALHSKQMMLQEVQYFSTHFTQSVLHSDPIVFAQQTMDTVNHYVFVKTGLLNWLNNAQVSMKLNHSVFMVIRGYIEAIIYITMTFIIRLLILFFTSPLFILVAIVGFTDGLVRRDLRRFGYGYESSFMYHHAKRAILPLLISSWMLYLSLPFSIYPNFLLIPAAFFVGTAISIASASFKKYL
ncbi:TIGR03747 family integrating conjugative element membrane protein [Gallibacterium anatis]|uniref:TIGR03747 family integrating conjugative element membrane protein n=1 Tax=Gallibacterium anatis TaxID=750 RepID=UPI000802726B|nr:TIGR03747 family integrating conjugative element membrane protein [Gallibacterium anatis]OBW95828.1 membrane protein [Gallibacterium anatis]